MTAIHTPGAAPPQGWPAPAAAGQRGQPASLFAGTGPAQLIPLALIMLVGVRLVEFLPILAPIRPVLLLALGGGAYLWNTSTPAKRTALLHDRVFRMLVLYLVWAAFTVPFAIWPGMASDTMRGLVVCCILVGAIMLLSPIQLELRRATSAFVLASCIYVLLLLTTGSDIGNNRLQVGMSLDSNDAAAVFAVCVPLALGLARTAEVGRKLWWVAAAALLVFGIVATGSRGGTLALVAGSLVFALGLKGVSKFGYLLLMMAVGFAAWQWGPPDYRERMTLLISGVEDYNQTEYDGREVIWERGRQYYRENPFLGVGAGNFAMAEGRQLEALGFPGKWSAPHNSYLQAFAELGTPGGLIFLAILLGGIRQALPLWRPRRGSTTEHRPEFLAAILGAMVGGYFLSHAYAFHMMITMALATLAGRALSGTGSNRTHDPVIAALAGLPRHPRMQRILASHPRAKMPVR